MPKNPSVFISYRRSDSSAITGRLYDRLIKAFGKSKIFKDSYNIAHGADFREVITNNVSSCDVVLVIIGPTWLTVTEKDNPALRRIDDPSDWVRFEIETGLDSPGIIVIPVLVQNAHMPAGEALPESLRELAYKNAVAVRDDPDFDTDIARLIQELTPDRTDNKRVIFGLLLIAVALVAFLVFNNRPKTAPTTPNVMFVTDMPAPTPLLEMSRTPNSDNGLVIGGHAKVRLSYDFPQLDVRVAASNTSALIDRLDEGEIVAILDGPMRDADNSAWMKIRTPNGFDGWAPLVLSGTQSLLSFEASGTG